MSLRNTDGMKYEAANITKPSAGTGKRVAIRAAETLGTGSLVWLLAKRHKVALLAIGNVVLVLNWAFPAWAELVKSLI